MTPDTAALRALADAATPGPWTYIGKGDFDTPPIDVDEADWGPEGHHGYRLRTWSDGTGWRNADAAFIAALDPDTVRALCDAADEVERLREEVAERDTRLAETIRYHDARVNRADEATDASRTAHAALVAELRALHVREVAQRQTGHGDNAEGIWLCAECLTEYPCRTAALLDRHTPTTGATP